MATTVLGLKTFTASDPVDYNDVNDNYNKIDNGVKTAFHGSAAHNWLDNSDMTNAVNQRGQSSYTGQVYGIDRWRGRAVAQTVSVRSTDVTVTATATSYVGIKQKIDGMSRLAGKTVTFAAKIYSKVVPQLVFFNASDQSLALKAGTAGATQTIILTYTIPSDATSDSVVPTILLKTSASGDYMRIYWAAIYEGSYDANTLPAYQPKGYAAELAECQRYYWPLSIMMRTGYCTSASIILDITSPVPMRVNPTVNLVTAGSVYCNGVGPIAVTGATVGRSGNVLKLTASYESTTGISTYAGTLANAALEFSADL